MPRGRPPKNRSSIPGIAGEPRQPRVAPDAKVTDYSQSDERMELVRRYAPECVGPNAEWSEYFDDPSVSAEYYARQGYIPVTLSGGEQVNHKGDRLWKRPRAQAQAERDAAAQRGLDLANSAKEPGNETYADGRLVEVNDQ